MSEVEGKIAQQRNSNAPPTGKWTTGLYDCFDDKGNCCFTWVSPHDAFGSNAEIIDQGRTSAIRARLIFFGLGLLGLGCLYSYKFRIKLRSLYNLPEEPCSDCCVHSCCLLCAICQEHRELKNRGIYPSTGWKANEERMKKANLEAPRVASAMTR
ncbi:protein PLANT CADMIUM RESISTANCE 9-like [Vigna umbellata]|uniref:protein PLANT CADMIUM RESISTANCE 9-like n=1 Tax=Vigna umbellata TaxID=87088 RepID=UPI001F5F9B5F|nr:protein PLANT CADMIUM RESISTANCE 9-like [Vigna umbellata]